MSDAKKTALMAFLTKNRKTKNNTTTKRQTTTAFKSGQSHSGNAFSKNETFS
jgi:hypothetical protein